MSRSLSRLFLVLTLPALGACSDIAGSNQRDELLGVYQLITINGQVPPVVVDQSATEVLEITAGTVTLADNGFTDATTTRLTTNGVPSTETETALGNWTLAGQTVRFTPNDNSGQYSMTWDGGDKLTQNFQGIILVYQR